MEKGTVQIIYGSGRGKSSLALGRCIDAISKGKTAIIIQFLKGNLNADRLAVIDRLEPELQVFRFEKSVESFANLSEEEKAKELIGSERVGAHVNSDSINSKEIKDSITEN